MIKKFIVYSLWFMAFMCGISFADTIYLTDGTTQKGLVVEEYYDRFVFNTADGEKEVLKPRIDEVFFDEPYQNSLYLGRRFEEAGDFERALRFYKLALQSNPDFKEAEDAIKGLEDAKWRFGKTWRYAQLKEILKAQLGISLRQSKNRVVVSAADEVIIKQGDILKSDAIISCWGRPLTCAGLKNSAKILSGLSNTILKAVVEREIVIVGKQGFQLFSPVEIDMEFDGPRVASVKETSAFYNSGLRQGDLIVGINRESTRYMKLGEVKKKMLKAPLQVTVRKEVVLMRKRSAGTNSKNAMWVWHSKEVLMDEGRRKELLDFCKEKNIGTLFFQLQYQLLPYKGQSACRLLYETRLRDFLREAHSQAIKVHALDGAPLFCLEDNHKLLLAQLEAILRFNKIAPPQERFDGVHYDNEPYLLPAFNSQSKEDIIRQFLALNQKCKDLINSSGAKLEYGIDIPFWFDQIDSLDRKLVDICDNVGIMDYRNFASGPDGIIAHVMAELKYAAETKKKIFVGIETSRYPRQEAYFVSVLSEGEFNKALLKEELAGFVKDNRFEGFLSIIHAYDKKIYVGLIRPEGTADADFNRALAKLEDLFGGITRPQAKEDLDKLAFDIINAISNNPELRDIEAVEYSGPDGKVYLLFRARQEMLEKLTFADMTEADLNNVLAEAKAEFDRYPSFGAFAIHHYKSYKELCERKK